MPAEIREISRHTKRDIIEAYFTLSQMSPEELAVYEPRTVLELGIIKCLYDFAASGRTDQMKHLWAECHGRPHESISASITSEDKIDILIRKLDGEDDL